MIGIATALLALSVADLMTGGLTGEPQRFRRLLLGIVSAFAASWLVLGGSCLPMGTSALLLAGATLGAGCWLTCKLQIARADHRQDAASARRWASAALLSAGLSVSLPLACAAALHADMPALTAWARALPFSRLRTVAGAEVVLLLAILLFLTAPANAIVRCLLTAARTEWKASEQKLRGGRYIGVIERWMIFSLALAGEPTAAALIVSAKSLLRFPELSKAAENPNPQAGKAVAGIDEVTEYFLLGSLASWGLALVFVLLLV